MLQQHLENRPALGLRYLVGLRIVLTFSYLPILTGRALSLTTETPMPNQGFCFDFHVFSSWFNREDSPDGGENISVMRLLVQQIKLTPHLVW